MCVVGYACLFILRVVVVVSLDFDEIHVKRFIINTSEVKFLYHFRQSFAKNWHILLAKKGGIFSYPAL